MPPLVRGWILRIGDAPTAVLTILIAWPWREQLLVMMLIARVPSCPAVILGAVVGDVVYLTGLPVVAVLSLTQVEVEKKTCSAPVQK